MSIRKAKAVWNGTLKEGKGVMKFSNYEGPYSFTSRFEEGAGTNPEELIGAAIAGCFSMFLSALISNDNLVADTIDTDAKVILEKDDIGPKITSIELNTNVTCQGLSNERFKELVEKAESNCPIARLYRGGTSQLTVNAVLAG